VNAANLRTAPMSMFDKVIEDSVNESDSASYADPVGCPLTPVLHDRRRRTIDQEQDSHSHLLQAYERETHGFVANYEQYLRPGTFKSVGLLNPSTPIPGAQFIFWGFRKGGFFMSLSDEEGDNWLEAKHHVGGHGNPYHFIRPQDNPYGSAWPPIHLPQKQQQQQQRVDPSTTGTTPTNYVVFASLFFEQYQHLLIDHVGYLAYLKHTLPTETTKFILFDSGNGFFKELLQEWDPSFESNRVEWVICQKRFVCNQPIHLKYSIDTIQVVTPQSTSRHGELLQHARRWLRESYWSRLPPLQPHEHTIIYYSRHSPSAQTDRAMDLEQETKIMEQIQHFLMRFHRPEKLVVYNGDGISIGDQMRLFRSANMVIGAHGGGLANILFMEPDATASPISNPPRHVEEVDIKSLPTCHQCHRRPKVLEFITNPLTPELQHGLFSITYLHMYAVIPWVELHHVMYQPGSTPKSTFVSFDDVRDALLLMFDDNPSLACHLETQSQQLMLAQ
jgi:hypothetical protein